MSLDIKVPSVGESITEVTIANWHKKDGDSVNVDDVLCELESDKATFELNAESAGVLRIVAQEGETVPIGGLICRIEDGNGVASANGTAQAPKTAAKTEPTTPAANPVAPIATPTPQPQPQATPPAQGNAVEMKVPAVGESINEVTIGTWQKKDGDQVQPDEVLCEIESDKATFELTAEVAGTLRIVAQQGETLPIGALICRIETASTPGLTVPSEPYAAPKEVLQAENQQSDQPGNLASNVKEAPIAGNYAAGHASPSAAKILAEKGIDQKGVQGTGPDGRIIKADALNAQKPVTTGNNQPAATPKAPETKPAAQQPAAPAKAPSQSSEARSQRRQKMTSLRKTIARRLVAVKNETAMLTTFNEVDMKPIMDLRAKYKDKFKEKHSVGLGFMSFFAKACCVALQEWPAVNAMIDGEEMVFNDFCDISVAVSTPKGLVVPVIRNADQMSFAGIEAEIIRLATRARDGKLGIDEMTGGTFTITNGGVFGSMMSTPIINAPQSAILGMHNIVERPVVVDGQIVVRPMMYVALSYDHRIIDGRESVSFLVRVKQLLEDPMRLLLEV